MAAEAFTEIARKHGIRLLLQFGSTVRGGVHGRSDVDLAVWLERPEPTLAGYADLLHDLQGCFPDREVDLAILNHADPLFLRKVTERSFTRLGSLGILPPDFASRIAACTGLRNRLVHEYDEIDPRRVHEGLMSAVRDIPEYLQRVHEYVERAG